MFKGATAKIERCAKPIDLKVGQALQFVLIELAAEEIEETIRNAYNKQLSEMAVGVEAAAPMPPLNCGDSLGLDAPRPPLRQAARRYAIYTLLRWNIESDFYDIIMMQKIYIMSNTLL